VLSKDDMRKLKSKLLMLKSNAISTTSDLSRFLDDVRGLFACVETRIKVDSLKSFVCLVPADLGRTYLRLVEDDVAKPKAKATKRENDTLLSERNVQAHIRDVLLESRCRQESDERLSQSQTQFSQADVGGALRSQPSKRAKMMLSAAAGMSAAASKVKSEPASITSLGAGSAAKPKQSFLSQMAGLDNIALSGAVRGSNLAATAPARHSQVGSSKLTCAVCKEKASTPCAGRCGHVCCQDCWVRWLKVNSSCPLCRAPASTASVTKIIIK
jgi:hypothetical protein